MARARSAVSNARRIEREAARHLRELDSYGRAQTVWEERQRAEHEASVYESKIEFLVSMHKDCGPIWDWLKVATNHAPSWPEPTHLLEEQAVAAASSYKPTFFEALFGGEKRRRADFKLAIAEAQQREAQALVAARAEYAQQLERFQWERQVSAAVLAGDLKAYRTVIDDLSPFSELVDSGMNVAVDVLRQDVAVLRCMVRDNSAVPREEKKVSAKGKLTSKTMAVSTYWGVYQDYVCGCALRVAREIFALLPVPRVVINIAIAGLDSSTGHDADSTILAVSMPREIAAKLNYDALDPSDSLKNFSHRIKFKKSVGFEPVDPMSADESFITTSGRR